MKTGERLRQREVGAIAATTTFRRICPSGMCPFATNGKEPVCFLCRWYDRRHDTCYMDLPIMKEAFGEEK